MDRLPKIQERMVVVFRTEVIREYLLVLSVCPNGDLLGYRLRKSASGIEFCGFHIVKPSQILEIYGNESPFPDGGHIWPSENLLLQIMRGTVSAEHLIWKHPETVDMTVDEISERLGYRVRVVGNETTYE